MNKINVSSLTIEEFAAYLDGSLSPDTMQEIAGQTDFKELIEANNAVDQTYASILESGFEIPDELYSSDFQIPDIAKPIGFEDSLGAQMFYGNLHNANNNIFALENDLEGFNHGEEVVHKAMSIGDDPILPESQINIETSVDYTESQVPDTTDPLLY